MNIVISSLVRYNGRKNCQRLLAQTRQSGRVGFARSLDTVMVKRKRFGHIQLYFDGEQYNNKNIQNCLRL